MRERLLEAIRRGRAPHAVLITGPEGSGRRTLARRAASLFCLGEDAPERLAACPNCLGIDGETARVEDIRNLLASAAMQGFNGGRRAFVFRNAHKMSVQIQNTLLKTLEEPHEETMLILTGSEFGLLPTVRSRCAIVRLGAESLEKTASALRADGMDAASARSLAAQADGLIGRARALSDPDASEFRRSALRILEQAAFDYAPFTEAAELVTVQTTETDSETAPEGEPKAKSRKRRSGDAALASKMLDVWTGAFRDALILKTTGTKPPDADADERTERIASRFTTARIQGIIEMLGRAQQRLSGGASVYLTVDEAMLGLFIKES